MSRHLSRRSALVASLSAVPAFAGMAIIARPSLASAGNSDPVFAAIERHKAAWRAFGVACDLTDTVRAEKEDRVVTEADEAVYEAANEAEREARDAVFATPAQTPAGLRALIEHYIEYDAGLMDEVAAAFLASSLHSPLLGGSQKCLKTTKRRRQGSTTPRDVPNTTPT